MEVDITRGPNFRKYHNFKQPGHRRPILQHRLCGNGNPAGVAVFIFLVFVLRLLFLLCLLSISFPLLLRLRPFPSCNIGRLVIWLLKNDRAPSWAPVEGIP